MRRVCTALLAAAAVVLGAVDAMAQAFTSGPLPFTPPPVINVLDPPYKAKCDVIYTQSDGTISAGSNHFTSSTVTFASTDVGKKIVIAGAGPSAAPLASTINAVDGGGGGVTLAANASTTVPWYAAWNAVSLAAGTGYVPADTITLNDTAATVVTIEETQVVSATVAAGGSGGTTGTQTVTGTTGVGQLFTASVTVSGGAITAVLSITFGGSYTTNPTVLATEPVTGAALTGAQLNVVMGVRNVNITTQSRNTTLPSTTLSQAATSGAGTGATFTMSYTSPTWYYGTDDGTAINAALTAAVATPVVIPPNKRAGFPNAVGCLTTQQLELPTPSGATFGNGVVSATLMGSGVGKNASQLFAGAASMNSVVHRAQTFQDAGGVRELSINAFHLANYAVYIEGGDRAVYFNTQASHGIIADYQIGNGTQPAIENLFFNMTATLEPTIFLISQRPQYNMQVASGFTDNRFFHLVFSGASTADLDVVSPGNVFYGIHTYGYPPAGYKAQYGTRTAGTNYFYGNEMDSPGTVAGMYITQANVTVSGGWCQFPNYSFGNAACVLIASGVRNVIVTNVNTNGAMWEPPAQHVVQQGTADPSTIVCNNMNASYATCPSQSPSFLGSVNMGDTGTTANTISSQRCLTFGAANFCQSAYGAAIGNGVGANGFYSWARGYHVSSLSRLGSDTYGSNFFTVNGDAQEFSTVLSNQTTSTSPTRLTSDSLAVGTTNCVNLQANDTLALRIMLKATDVSGSPVTNTYSAWWYGLDLAKGATNGTTVLNGLATAATADKTYSVGTGTTATVTVTPDQTNGCLNITVTAPNSNTWNWVARVDAVETRH